MATGRPFFKSSTGELRDIVADQSSDEATLLAVLSELQHRGRPQAQALRSKLHEMLSKGTPAQVEEAVLPPRKSEERKPTTPPTKQESKTPALTKCHDKKPAMRQSADSQAAGGPLTLVQPQGVTGRPSAYRPELQAELVLELGEDDPLIKKYRVALTAWISELKQKRAGSQSFSLEDGSRVSTEGDGFSYEFDFSEEANLFEGAKVELVIGGQFVQGNITAVLQGKIIVTVSSDFGETIRLCVLKVDNTSLTQALCDRLQKIEAGEDAQFRSDFAEQVVTNQWEAQPLAALPSTKCDDLNVEQKQFIQTALSNNICWLWGPPGTGKTAALSVLTDLLYERGLRILICSNTNQAVDQVLLKLCDNLSKNSGGEVLKEGHVLRLGRVELDKLKTNYEHTITIDGVVAIKSEVLLLRKSEVEAELFRLGKQVAFAEDILKQFQQLDQAASTVDSNRSELALNEANLNRTKAAAAKCQQVDAKLKEELAKRRAAGALRRLVLRKEEQIRRELDTASSALGQAIAAAEDSSRARELCQRRVIVSERRVAELQHLLAGHDRRALQAQLEDCDQKRRPLRMELAEINAKLEELKATVLREARVVGATVTRTFLRPNEFRDFDVVIIDEASMIPLPAVFHTAGLSKKSVIVAGDFLQLPPIIQTSEKQISDVLGHDVFEVSGVAAKAKSRSCGGNLTMLRQQYRMDKQICRYVSEYFYEAHGNGLVSPQDPHDPPALPEPLNQTVTIVDTSSIYPFTTRNVFGSRFNLMHALVVRNAILHLRERECLTDSEGRGRIGVCTPYSAQAKLLRKVVAAHKLSEDVRASTAHGFQGDERSIIILDLVDSIGEQYAGMFLQAETHADQGAKLLNVAISRAKHALVIVANLTFLDAKLPSASILRGMLHDMQSRGRIVDAREVLALRPVLDDLQRFGRHAELDIEALKTGLFSGGDFELVAGHDMAGAEQSIVIFSGFITRERVAALGDLLRERIARGVKVRCVTRPPARNGTIPEEQAKEALDVLEAMGAAVDLRGDIHEKAVVIDGRIAWFGSLNPLSHTARTSEVMARVEDEGFAANLADFLSLKRGGVDASDPHRTTAENPRCEDCGSRSILKKGKFGFFYTCERCDWKRDLNATTRAKGKTAAGNSKTKPLAGKAGKCPKCGAPLALRNGRFGDFYSCSTYPKCDGKPPKIAPKKTSGKTRS